MLDDEDYSFWQRPQVYAEKRRRGRDILSGEISAMSIAIDNARINERRISHTNKPRQAARPHSQMEQSIKSSEP